MFVFLEKTSFVTDDAYPYQSNLQNNEQSSQSAWNEMVADEKSAVDLVAKATIERRQDANFQVRINKQREQKNNQKLKIANAVSQEPNNTRESASTYNSSIDIAWESLSTAENENLTKLKNLSYQRKKVEKKSLKKKKKVMNMSKKKCGNIIDE